MAFQERRRKSKLGLGGRSGDADAVGHLAQFILGEDRRKLGRIQLRQNQIVQRLRHRCITDDCHQTFAEASIFGMGLNRLTRLSLHLPRMRQEIVQRPISCQQLDGCFGTNARNPRDIVAGIPGEGQIVNHLLRRGNSPFGAELFGRKQRLIPGMENRDMRTGELPQVLIRGRNDDLLEPGLHSACGKCPQNIVRLIALSLDRADAPSFRQLLCLPNGGGDVFRHLLALGLVGRIKRVTKGRARALQGDSHMRRVKKPQHLFQRGREKRERGGHDSGGRTPRVFREDEMPPIEDRHQVDQKQRCSRHARLLSEAVRHRSAKTPKGVVSTSSD